MTDPVTNVRTISDIVGREANQPTPGTMICESRVVRYDELDRRSTRVALALGLLVQPGARIGYLDTNSATFFELLFGAARAGVVVVPLNARLALPELVAIIAHAEIEVLFVGELFDEWVTPIRAACAGVQRVLAIAAEGTDEFGSWRDTPSTGQTLPAVQPGDVVLQVYTSGTVGSPKGVLLTHENLLAGVSMLEREYHCERTTDKALVCMPVYHVSGCLWALTCIYSGLSTCVLRKVTPQAIVEAVRVQRITITLIVPTLIRMLLMAPDQAQMRADLSSLRLLLYGGSAIPLALLEQALAAWPFDFGQVYGLTETGGAITYLSPADHRSGMAARLRSCGRPLAQAEVRVVDEQGTAVPAGSAGEIVCRSSQNMKGYWRRDDANHRIGEGWLRTGDIGSFDADGYLSVHERIDDMIVSAGENVYPSEVESVLALHPAVADVGVVGINDEHWVGRIQAFVVLQPGATATGDELNGFLRARIASYKIPKSITFMAALPRNAAGKLLRRELRVTAH